MTSAPLVLLVALLGVGDALTDAQRAFSAGRYEEAERLALRAARPPQEGAALYLVGLARFRAGHPAEALEALDAAARAPDAPEPTQWSFNRGACLYALERLEEAERAFAVAGANEALARLAWVNAGFAALDAGAPERAEQWAERARVGASERELAQVEELRTQIAHAREHAAPEEDSAADSPYARGLAAFDAGRFEQAHTLFLEAARQPSEPGRAWLMAGAASYRAGNPDTAREELARALEEPLSPGDAEVAHAYGDRLSLGARARGPGFALSVGGGGGYDSNVFQVGVASRDVSGVTSLTQTGSPFGEAGLALVRRVRVSDGLFAELSYAASQRAYTDTSAQDYSLQLHHLGALLEWEAARRLRLGVVAGGDLFFTGLSAFRGLQASASALAWAALDESEATSTRLEAAVTPKRALVDEFDYLSGQRLEAGVGQELRGRTWGATARYQYRAELIGTLVQEAATDAAVTSQAYVIPYSWTGHAVGLQARVTPLASWEARLEGGVEWRRYVSDSFLRVQTREGATAEWGRRRREDWRGWLGAAAGLRLSRHLQASARYELLLNLSNMDTRLSDTSGCTSPTYVCHRYDYTNGNFQKHQITVELGAVW